MKIFKNLEPQTSNFRVDSPFSHWSSVRPCMGIRANVTLSRVDSIEYCYKVYKQSEILDYISNLGDYRNEK